MNAYAIARFLHLVGAMGFFMTLGLEWTGLRQIRSALNQQQVRGWIGILENVQKVGFATMLGAVITGVYLTLTVWGGAAWIYVTLGALALVILLAVALTGPRMAAIGRALATDNVAVSQTPSVLANHPLLWISIQTRVAITLGIVLLKIARPDLRGSLTTIGVAIGLGLASALPLPRREKARERSAG